MDWSIGLALLVLLLGFAISLLFGLLGIGGGIVMAPAALRIAADGWAGGWQVPQQARRW